MYVSSTFCRKQYRNFRIIKISQKYKNPYSRKYFSIGLNILILCFKKGKQHVKINFCYHIPRFSPTINVRAKG